MLFHPRRTIAPAVTPVNLQDFKEHLRVTSNHEDALLEDYLEAATDYLDGWSGRLGRCLISQTWVQPFEGWPVGRRFVLPFPQVSNAGLIVRYLDAAGDWQTLDAGLVFDPVPAVEGSILVIKQSASMPALYSGHPAPVEIQFVAGYGAPGDVPADLRSAIKLIGGALYMSREAFVVGTIINDLPQVERILRNYQTGMRI